MNAKQTQSTPSRALEKVTPIAIEQRHDPRYFGQQRPQQLSLPEIKELATLFVQSKMFDGVTDVAQAFVKIKAGEELGFSPFISMSGIDIIKGKATIGADLQASLVKDSGKYRYHVKQLDNDACVLEFFERIDGKWQSLGPSAFSISDAERAGLAGKGGRNADMYDKFRRNMLFSRAMTQGTTWYTPDLLRSAGTREEVSGFDVDQVITETETPDVQHADAQIVEQVVEPVEDEAAPVTAEDSDVEYLRKAVSDKIREITGNKVEATARILKGRVVALMEKNALIKFLAELDDEPPF